MEPAIQVSPITEGEMNTLKSLFARFADTIVAASTMQDKIDQMQFQLDSLTRDAEFLRTRNRELDESVQEVRRQRDQALADVATRDARIKELESNVSYDSVTVDALRRDVSGLGDELASVKRDRDEWMQLTKDYEQKNTQAKEWIDNITRLFNSPLVL